MDEKKVPEVRIEVQHRAFPEPDPVAAGLEEGGDGGKEHRILFTFIGVHNDDSGEMGLWGELSTVWCETVDEAFEHARDYAKMLGIYEREFRRSDDFDTEPPKPLVVILADVAARDIRVFGR